MIRPNIVIATVIGVLLTAVAAGAQELNVEQIVKQRVQPILPQNGKGGGVAVAVRMNGKTSFFNYGMADDAKNRPVTSDSIFNLGSVGKLFATTSLAQAVKQGELSLDDPVAKYVTELQRGGDIRRVTLGQRASHTSGLPRVPGQYEHWHRGKYTWPDFVRFLNSWKADSSHELSNVAVSGDRHADHHPLRHRGIVFVALECPRILPRSVDRQRSKIQPR